MGHVFCYLLGFIGLLMNASANAELIVLASPIAGDAYYADVVDDIFDFHVAYARQISSHDNVLILTDKEFYDDYVAELGAGQSSNCANA